MFQKLKVNMGQVYPTLVVSTMSSGKSTLINALIGEPLLPSRNQACTARAVAILDNDLLPDFIIHAVTENGEYSRLEKATIDAVAEFNETHSVSEMILEGQIKGIKNSKKSLMLFDTPGINYSLNPEHEEETKRILDLCDSGLILYVINFKQIATQDDSKFLNYIAEKVRKNDRLSVIFVINQMDSCDPQKESPIDCVNACRDYIMRHGINEPVIIPVSSRAALLFKMVLQGNSLSRHEKNSFISYYEQFKGEGFSLANYVSIPNIGNMEKELIIADLRLTRADLYAALYNTGFTILEDVIEETLVRSLKMRAPKITRREEQQDSGYHKMKIKKRKKNRRK